MGEFQNIANLNLVADVALTNDDQIVMVDATDHNAYKATVAQVSDHTLGHGVVAIDESGAKVTVTGSLSTTSDLKVNTNKFTVTATSGNTAVAGTLGVTGDVAVNTNKFNVTASNGNTATAGTLSATGDFKVNTNKFIVTASSGNTTIAGTLTLNGQAVTFGDNDSGGTGYRLLVVPNA